MVVDIRLTPEIFERYGDRKEKGRIDFVVDVDSRLFYAVPKELFACIQYKQQLQNQFFHVCVAFCKYPLFIRNL